MLTAQTIELFDVVALTNDLPAENLPRGQVGTVVERLGDGSFEVEFSDDQGRTYAQAALPADRLIVLRYKPNRTA